MGWLGVLKQPGVGRWQLGVWEDPETAKALKQAGVGSWGEIPHPLIKTPNYLTLRFWVDCIRPLKSLPVWFTNSLIMVV